MDAWRRRMGAKGGYTLLEAVLALIIASGAILTIALGLLTSGNADQHTNSRQRVNLALSTFTENLKYSLSECPAVSSPAPSSGRPANPPSHATTLLDRTLEKAEVAKWVDRGIVFTVTDVEYGDTDPYDFGAGVPEAFDGACSDPAPTGPSDLRPPPWYPVIRVTVQACFGLAPDAVDCPEGEPVEQVSVVKRGGRRG